MEVKEIRMEKIRDQWRVTNGDGSENNQLQITPSFASLVDIIGDGNLQVNLKMSSHPFANAEILDRKKAPNPEEKGNNPAIYRLTVFRRVPFDMEVNVDKSFLEFLGRDEFPEQIFLANAGSDA